MGRLSASLLLLALAACAALGLSACGGGGDDDLLPGETASEITSNIDAVERLVGEGDCVGAEDASATISGQVESLTGVDPKLKEALGDGAARLNEVVAECEEEPEEETIETIEPEDTEGVEDEEKPKKNKEEKPEKEAEEEAEEDGAGPTLPPQSNGKGEEKGGGPPEEEAETPSGGVSPGAAVEGE
ncbi:MAG TPA: hypothetical protein VMS60_11095 [Solirubrobacterales bacterium]|nr:hypothetical protein [Solirubrobacterales bacterium]